MAQLLEKPKPQRRQSTQDRFTELGSRDPVDQCEFFLKSFIFALGDKWKDVPRLKEAFTKHAKSTGPDAAHMNHIQAADFLQHHGKTRTGLQRKTELEDIDLNNDGQICFVEMLLLLYKTMILGEYYKRLELEPEEDLSGDGVGLVGVGDKLVSELLALPKGLNPQLEAAIESFTEQKRARETKMSELARGG